MVRALQAAVRHGHGARNDRTGDAASLEPEQVSSRGRDLSGAERRMHVRHSAFCGRRRRVLRDVADSDHVRRDTRRRRFHDDLAVLRA